jgi:predicted Zn-dependent peptidase
MRWAPKKKLRINLWSYDARAVFFLILFLGFVVVVKRALGSENVAKSFELINGLKIFLLEKRNFPLVNAVAAVNLGSKDETAETSGLVHMLEHYILFRGTEFRSGSEVSQDVRRHGAYFNAHTGEDLAFFEISVPSADAEFALRNQREILFNLKLTQEALDREKEVILEELSHMEDDPDRYATFLVYQNLFKGHPYENPLYGNKEVIKSIAAEKMEEFYRRYFVPSNCSLAVVGDFGLRDMEEKIRNIFGDIKGEALEKPKFCQAKPLEKSVELNVEMDIKKAYLVIGALAPDYNHPDQYAMDVLTEIFGRNVNPMLNSVLRGNRRLAETIFMAYHAHKYGGVALIYLTLDPKNLEAAKRETVSFLRKSRDESYSPEDFFGEQQIYAYDFLAGAKNQIRYDAFKSQEKGLFVAASLASYMLLKEGLEDRPYLENIDKVKSSDLRKAAAKYFSRSNYVIISVIPKKNK